MRNISLNVNCAAKRSQNLQKSEFKKARQNSNCVLDFIQHNSRAIWFPKDYSFQQIENFLSINIICKKRNQSCGNQKVEIFCEIMIHPKFACLKVHLQPPKLGQEGKWKIQSWSELPSSLRERGCESQWPFLCIRRAFLVWFYCFYHI